MTCGVHLHGVEAVRVEAIAKANRVAPSAGGLTITPTDSALVSIGPASPLPTPLIAPNVSEGVHFALVGNIWNTNYPFWYPFEERDASSQFRFAYDLDVEA